MPPGLTSPVHLLVVLVVALIVLGPEQLPGALRTAGRWIGEIRRWSASLEATLQAEIERGMHLDADRPDETTRQAPEAPGGGPSPSA